MTRPYYTRLEDGIGYRLSDLIRSTDLETWAILVANEFKASYNAHLASTTYHTAADAVNTITSVDATDLASLIVLLNEARGDYEAHRILVGVGPVHGSADLTHVISAPVAVDLTTAVALLKDLAYQYGEHRLDISGSPAIHLAEDTDRFFWPYVKKVAAYGGRIEDIVQLKKRATKDAPFILVQAQGGVPKRATAGGMYYRGTRIAVLLIDKSKRGQEEQRRGSDHALEPPGLYQMVEDVCDRLVNKQPVDSVGATVKGEPWVIVGEDNTYNDPDIQIWTLMFESMVAHTWVQVDRSTLHTLDRADGSGDSKDAVRGDYDGLELTLNTWP